MKNILLYVVLSCLLLACQDKGEALREKRITTMIASYEKALERYNYEHLHQLIVKVRKEGNSPEGLAAVKLAQELHQQTKEILASLSKDTKTPITSYKKWWRNKLKPFVDTQRIQEIESLVSDIKNKKIQVLHLEDFFLKNLSSSDMELGFFFERLLTFAPDGVQHLYENEVFNAHLYLSITRRGYISDSVWVNGVFKKENPFRISLPVMRAGKHTIDLKIKCLHREIPEKDTVIFYTHTFNVLPK